MRWLAFVVGLLTLLAALGLGLRVGRVDAVEGERGARRSTAALGVSLAALLLRVALRPSHELALPLDLYAVVRPWWPAPFALLALGVAARRLSTDGARKGALLLAALVLVVTLHRLACTAAFDPGALTGRVEADGVCRQTHGKTCGAAAAATLLAHHGVAADEAEMAARCVTNDLTGTDLLGVVRGLRQKLEGTGRAVALRHGGWDDLRAPAMVTLAHGALVDHWVVVRAVAADRVVVGDPLVGVRELSREEFTRVWRGALLVVE